MRYKVIYLYFCLAAERGSKGHLDLTELIGVPLPPSVYFITGYGGFPAYSFGPDANIGRLTRALIPQPFYRDFAVVVTVKPNSNHGGVLFAITDAFQKTIYLGMRLSPVDDGTQRIIMYYTEPGSHISREAASFKVPVMTNKWNRFTVTVQGNNMALFMDCEEYQRVQFQRSAQALEFDPSSGIFVGNAGATGLEKFTVSTRWCFHTPKCFKYTLPFRGVLVARAKIKLSLKLCIFCFLCLCVCYTARRDCSDHPV